jgi:hypothetical protein
MAEEPPVFYPNWTREDFLRVLTDEYLTNIGWLRSTDAREALDLRGPLPWFTYAAIRALETMVPRAARVLEFGAGNSTLWWAARTASVTSVEHDAAWERKVRSRLNEAGLANAVRFLPPAATIPDEISNFVRAHPADHDETGFLSYAAAPLEHDDRYDVVVIDGRSRSACALIAPRLLRNRGIIVFDNSDRADYQPGYAALVAAGFVRIDFWGIGPINPYEWCTSIFVDELASLGAGR